jgi:hypothetical protein
VLVQVHLGVEEAVGLVRVLQPKSQVLLVLRGRITRDAHEDTDSGLRSRPDEAVTGLSGVA